MSFQTMNAILRMGRRAQAALAAVLLLGASLCAVQAQEIVYYHTDALGTPVAMTNANGAVIQRREFEPYGRQLDPAVLADGPGFTGHVADAATGLVYMQQRYYDPELGRTLSRDPVTAFSSGDMRHFNGYAYGFNNPYRFTDPDGRSPVDDDPNHRPGGNWKPPARKPPPPPPPKPPCSAACMAQRHTSDHGGTKSQAISGNASNLGSTERSDQQDPHANLKRGAVVGGMAGAAVGVWVVASLLAPETGGASLGAAEILSLLFTAGEPAATIGMVGATNGALYGATAGAAFGAAADSQNKPEEEEK